MVHAMDVFYCKRCATLRSGVPGQRVPFHEERAGSWRSNGDPKATESVLPESIMPIITV